jgi:hypothetical protein
LFYHFIFFSRIGIPLSIKKHIAGDPVIGILQLGNYDPTRFSVDDLFDYGIKIVDVLIDDDKFTTGGIVSMI